MRIAVIAPGGYSRAAVIEEANRAAADGHRVIAFVAAPNARLDPDFARGIELRHDDTARVRKGRLARLWLVKYPMAGMRRLQRGPLRRPVGKARALYADRVSKPLSNRLERQSRRLERDRYAHAVAERVRAWEPDHVVLLNVEAVALAEGFLPWLESRSATVSYAYAGIPIGADH
ncbi:hypothetical protein AB0B28_07405 [Glycomyces sp. NPDC046736]|uniref:hypothetical protein n=1 Tax=Glycomyces sp. NPDC046736 TaxID=3155615 RepID=UPI0033E8CA54